MGKRIVTWIALLIIGLAWLLRPVPARGGAGVLFDLLKAYSIYQKGRVLFGGKRVAKEIGRSVDRAVRKQFGVEEDPQLNAWVSSIFSRIKAAAPPDYNYTCTIIKADFVNAMAVPGGYTYVTVPLLELINTDDELASVMGHEVAHVVKNHGMDMAKRNIALGTIIEAALKDEAEYRDEVNLMYNLFMLTYSRENEYEADSEGMAITAAAGYNPLGMVSFLKLMLAEEENQKNRPMEWLSTHPTTEGRIMRVKQEIYLKHADLSKPMYLSYAERVRQRRPANLIPNGGFEVMTGEAGAPARWTIRQGNGRWNSGESYRGEACLLCGENSAAATVLSDRFALNPEKTYALQGYLKVKTGGSVSFHLACFDQEGHLKKLGILPTELMENRFGWRMITGRIEPEPSPPEKKKKRSNRSPKHPPPEAPAEPAGATREVFTIPADSSRVQLTLVVTTPFTDTIFLDELALHESGPEAGETVESFNLIRNGGFELDINRDRQPDGWSLSSGISVARPKAFEGYTSLLFEGLEISSLLAKKLAEYRQKVYHTPIGGEEIVLTAPPVPVTEDRDYLIGIHSLGYATVETFEVRAEVLDGQGETIEGAGGKTVFTTSGYWQQHCMVLRELGIPPFLKIPKGRKPALVRLTLRSNLRPESKIWFDSFYMKETDKPQLSRNVMFTTIGP